MKLNTKGLILKEQNVGELDKLVTVLTADLGVIKAFVRGAKSIKSKRQSATGLLCYSKLSLYNGKDSYIIDEAECIEVFFGLRSDIEKLSLAQYFAELSCELAPELSDASEYLRVVLNSLYMISNSKKPDLQIKAITELRLLSLSGYMPNLVACERCGEFETDTMYFDIEHGLLYCENCASQDVPLALELSVVSAMRHIIFSKLEKLYSFNMSEAQLQDLSYVTETYLKAKTERRYKTLDFYNSLRNV